MRVAPRWVWVAVDAIVNTDNGIVSTSVGRFELFDASQYFDVTPGVEPLFGNVVPLLNRVRRQGPTVYGNLDRIVRMHVIRCPAEVTYRREFGVNEGGPLEGDEAQAKDVQPTQFAGSLALFFEAV